MKSFKTFRTMKALSLDIPGDYNIEYSYDAKGRVQSEIVTGCISKTTTYSYDSNDNISSEAIEIDNHIITKSYGYDSVTGNITSVTVTTTVK